MARQYSSVAGEKELSSGIDDSTQSVPLNNVTGLPGTFPYTLIIDHDTATEEIVTVTNAAGTTLTVDRGEDGTVGLSHESGAKVVHGITARDLQESRDHEDASTDVHGVGSGNSVVGTGTVQTLEGKTVDGGDNTLQNVPQSAITDLVSDQATQDSDISDNAGNISSLTTSLSNHEAATNVHGVSTVAGLSEAQTLNNKDISPENGNTLYGWVPVASGTAGGSPTFTMTIPDSGDYELLRLYMRGNLSEAGARQIGMRFNGGGNYDYELEEFHNGNQVQVSEGEGVSIPRVAQWDGSLPSNLQVLIFGNGVNASWQARGWRAFGAPAQNFGSGEHNGSVTIDSILFSFEGSGRDFSNVRWQVEGYRIP